MSVVATVRTDLFDAWNTQLGSDGVGCDLRRHPPADEAVKSDQAWIGAIRVTQVQESYSERVEELEITANIVCVRGGVGDTIADAAQAAALNILNSLEKTLTTDPTPGTATIYGHVERFDIATFPSPDGMGSAIEATITVDSTWLTY